MKAGAVEQLVRIVVGSAQLEGNLRRPDLATPVLDRVKAPTLLIVGGADVPVIQMNQEALKHLGALKHRNIEKRLEIVPGATHLFEEPGALEEVARLAREWFRGHLKPYTNQ